MLKREILKPRGFFKATHICRTKGGIYVPLDSSFLATDTPIADIAKDNLVVNTGRAIMAKSLGGFYQDESQEAPYINRITLGEGEKAANLPSLADTGLVQEVLKLSGSPGGTFLLAGPSDPSPDITFPAATDRFPVDGSFTGPNATITVNGDGETIFEDLTVDFIGSIGVELTDQVTIDNSATNPLVFGIRSIISATQLELHNPYGFTGSNIEWKIGRPGTQMLVSKLIEGNDFTVAEYGEAVVIHEAGLLFNNSTLFNRVVFAPDNEESGVLLQSDETTGVEVSVRFEWLITV